MIETERLLLRRWKKEDLLPFTALNQDPLVLEHLLKPLTKEETQSFIERIETHFDTHGYGLFACEIKENSEFIGFVGLNIPIFKAHFTPCVEIAWRLTSSSWGKGYATEAAKAVMAKAFTDYQLTDLVSFTVPANQRSINVMEKLNMTRDPKDDFYHPLVPEGHKLKHHILYRKSTK